MTSKLPALRLRPNEHKRLNAGHLWVFSNEVDTRTTPLKNFTPGQLVSLERSDGKAIGVAYVNPHSLICARLLSRDAHAKIHADWLRQRLGRALAWRKQCFPGNYYRWVFAESDGLPGLILDRYGDYCVGQINTAGMEVLRPLLEEVLNGMDGLRGLLWRNDSSVRELEGLAREVVAGFGEVPERLLVEEAGLQFQVDPREGQKTGWFYDQRRNRDELEPYWGEARVLDLFSYVGGWSMRALAAGAKAVTAVDRSAPAMSLLASHVEQTDWNGRLVTQVADVDQFLIEARAQRERYDVVVLDPPALVKKAKDKGAGLAAYRRLNSAALSLVRYGGMLVSCSCSSHVSEADLLDVVRAAARHSDREVQVVRLLQQGPDHPVLPAIPETRYLKGFVLRVMASDSGQ